MQKLGETARKTRADAPLVRPLEQPGRLGADIPARNDDLMAARGLQANRVLDRHRLDVESIEHPPDLRVIVQAHDRPPLERPQALGHPLVLLERKRNAITGRVEIRRIQVEQRMRAIVSIDALGPIQALDIRARKPQMRRRQILFQPDQVQARRGRCPRAESLPFQLAAKATFLQVVEPRRALDIGETFRDRLLEPFEHLTARQRPLKLPYKLLQMVLHHPIQVDQFPVDVVDHLDLGRRPKEVQRRPAREHLDVALVRRKTGDQDVCQTTLAAEPGNDGFRHCESLF